MSDRMNGCNQGRDCLASLNATRRVVHLPPLEEMPKKDSQSRYELGLWLISGIAFFLAVFSVVVIASCNPVK